MTVRSRLFALFPLVTLALLGACAVAFVRHPGAWSVLAALFVVYLLPVIVFRLHDLAWPLREEDTPLAPRVYSPWFGSHHFQLLFITVPQLEGLLRLVPGLYSAWLRLWGSRIGSGVHWTPRVDILDRSLLDIGNGVVFGHLSGTSSHIIRPAQGGLLLQVRRVRIGDGGFIGAGAYVGPGAVVEPRAFVRGGNHVLPFETVRAGAKPRAREIQADRTDGSPAEA